ncbi:MULTISPECIES: UvrD-helicase domain-containing protein [unclassified Pseudomonas]|uniref:UvrD-helicase domain-containing protein n=1 Tax=unclassified Pseudomonas TaxID=196821 RepID=UPI000A1EE67A|nr:MULTISPECIES: UvrD-helicase domain-containing protein [unclassified Pseudomonas]TFA85579.1 DNA helicase-2/ATP-dependent DNA helicase PcrA [Pseudomonas sp. LAIL14HWK12:I2]
MAAQLMENKYSEETDEILAATREGKNFLLSGGAGSGKTFSLVETISGLIEQKPLAEIACITYTNAAAQEVEHRASHENLSVSTIHDFLWSSIKHFQVELKETLIFLINDDGQKLFKVTLDNGEPDRVESIDGDVEYKEYVKLRKGVVSHDQIPVLAHAMFSKYPKLCRIINDKFKFILVDEYQDTSPLVVEILLEHLACTDRRNTVGFFGDAMQSIYDKGIGDLDAYKGTGKTRVTEIIKKQNRRNPVSVISLANEFRTDGLVQEPSNDHAAPNMEDGKPIIGTARFFHSKKSNVEVVRDYLRWDDSPLLTKELNLTHNLIATKAGFPGLMRVYDGDKILEYVDRLRSLIKVTVPKYCPEGKTLEEVIADLEKGKVGNELKKVRPTDGQVEYFDKYSESFRLALSQQFLDLTSIYIDKDMLIDDQKADQSMLGGGGTTRDSLIKHVHRIQTLIKLYQEDSFNEFMRATDLKIVSQKDKFNLREEIRNLASLEGKTIGEVIEQAHRKGLVRKDDRLENFIKQRFYVYAQVCDLDFSEFQSLYRYIDGKTPFSTQHKTKGREFDNVLVVMDNGRWNNYNFEAFFTGDGKDTVIARTSKIVYVCCTRAKKNLAFFYPEPSNAVIEKAQKLFGENNVIDLDK